MFLSGFFIRKKRIVFFFIPDKISTNSSQACFLSTLNIHFEVRFFVLFIFMLNDYTPFPYLLHSLARGAELLKKIFFGGSYVLLLIFYEQYSYLGSYLGFIFPFIGYLCYKGKVNSPQSAFITFQDSQYQSTLLSNIKTHISMYLRLLF